MSMALSRSERISGGVFSHPDLLTQIENISPIQDLKINWRIKALLWETSVALSNN